MISEIPTTEFDRLELRSILAIQDQFVLPANQTQSFYGKIGQVRADGGKLLDIEVDHGYRQRQKRFSQCSPTFA